jgi:hypothetical protein
MIEVRWRSSPAFGVYAAARDAAAVIAVVETVDDSGAIQQLVDAAAALIAPALPAAEWPRRFGELLHELMLDALHRRALASPGVFAAVACDGAAVHAVSAGNVRAHLVGGGALHAVTTDHILRTEPGTMSAASIARHGTAPSRAIGGSSYGPEVVTWPAPAAPVIVVCTEDVHRYRAPAEYAIDPWREPIRSGAIAVATLEPEAR